MKRQRPAGGWPHEQPGFVYFTPAMQRWLNGYEPTVAEDMLAGRSMVRDRDNARMAREAQMENGTGWRSGSMQGLSARADAQLLTQAQQRKRTVLA